MISHLELAMRLDARVPDRKRSGIVNLVTFVPDMARLSVSWSINMVRDFFSDL